MGEPLEFTAEYTAYEVDWQSVFFHFVLYFLAWLSLFYRNLDMVLDTVDRVLGPDA
jgi:hypothetical protein